ncbi:hypothetical protein SCP_0802430 [Sparassis crispa]|uniref:Major facilitator superfamily (MFS) profile domain-containing protein n=1 Tax=Sparassis crispa TaxID=139825 RepID=A0A401GU12_9APHY|nr:hypothetical protein SCP_0802430 [Sparassis crispa]GBE85721.1 hypothetical protein SCP_0802430 [Sparassis crispa]
MLQYRLYNGAVPPASLQGFLKVSKNIGSVIGQFIFSYYADYLGQKAVYEFIVVLTSPPQVLSSGYPSFVVSSALALAVATPCPPPWQATALPEHILLVYILVNQGWGSLIGGIAVIIMLACYKHVVEVEDEMSKVDGIWHILVGLSLIPMFSMLYQCLTLPESKQFEASQKNADIEMELINVLKKKASPENSITEQMCSLTAPSPPLLRCPHRQ